MGKRAHANLHLGIARLDARRADGAGNAAACQAALLASNNLTASRKGGAQPTVACLRGYDEPTLSHNAPTSESRAIALAYGRSKFYKRDATYVLREIVSR